MPLNLSKHESHEITENSVSAVYQLQILAISTAENVLVTVVQKYLIPTKLHW